ncbi:uncharacterized protein PHALS_13425 [Plasmopara halstedii]|uniref:Uncharacterized protein n=1 Tax=Plasmopara halstedii TaxID=4781 RepID=A0A0P1AP34_PLAHL|nr:uncharacterized protein PHALS_13425 [Plasmopara halstedii]CEG43212.1 hypothetical protein PHALS_13425 [Plasmopara halstedii]|eukprot:XP_024579581.1 hypothetical protein PHALS_13425 [Plasmopara halstedii]
MSTPDRAPRPPRATNYLVENSEKADHQSDTPFFGWEEEEGDVPQHCDMSPAQPLRTPCPISKLSTSGGSGVNTNDREEAQKQQLDAVRKAAPMRVHPQAVLDPHVDHGFRSADPATEAKDAITRSLGVYVVGPSITTQVELDEQNVFRARFLELSVDTYRTRLRA